MTPEGARPIVKVLGLEKFFGSNHVLRGCTMEVYPQRDDLPDRQVGLGQEHAPALHELPRGAHDRARSRSAASAWTPTRSTRATARIASRSARSASRPDGVPGVQPVPAPAGHRQPHRGAGAGQGRPARRGHRDRREVPGQGGPAREARRVPVAPVRRPEAAGRDRPGPDHGAQGAAVRRGDLGARSDAGRRGAGGDGGARPRGRHDDRGHPRDGLRPRGRRPRVLHRRGRFVEVGPPEAVIDAPRIPGRSSSSPAPTGPVPTSTAACRS